MADVKRQSQELLLRARRSGTALFHYVSPINITFSLSGPVFAATNDCWLHRPFPMSCWEFQPANNLSTTTFHELPYGEWQISQSNMYAHYPSKQSHHIRHCNCNPKTTNRPELQQARISNRKKPCRSAPACGGVHSLLSHLSTNLGLVEAQQKLPIFSEPLIN